MNTDEMVHPIMAQRDEIERRGLLVFDDIHRMPIYDEPYTTSFMTIGLNQRGWVKAECDMRPIVFREHDLAVVTPHHILCARESSSDYQAMLIVMSAGFQQKMKHMYADTYRDIQHYRYRQDVPLNDEQFLVVQRLFRLMLDVSRSESERRTEMLGDLLKVLFSLLYEYRQQNGIENHTASPREELFARFYKAIEEHYRESHEVKFYADLFCLTPKHFATVIKEQTGINALAWINNYVMLQAKSMLRHMQQLSIQQVGEQLGFTEQASFSRFFKNNAGITPSEYREQS